MLTKNGKKFLSLIALALLAAGCGSDEEEGNVVVNGSQPETVQPAPAPISKVGGSDPYGGLYASYTEMSTGINSMNVQDNLDLTSQVSTQVVTDSINQGFNFSYSIYTPFGTFSNGSQGLDTWSSYDHVMHTIDANAQTVSYDLIKYDGFTNQYKKTTSVVKTKSQMITENILPSGSYYINGSFKHIPSYSSPYGIQVGNAYEYQMTTQSDWWDTTFKTYVLVFSPELPLKANPIVKLTFEYTNGVVTKIKQRDIVYWRR